MSVNRRLFLLHARRDHRMIPAHSVLVGNGPFGCDRTVDIGRMAYFIATPSPLLVCEDVVMARSWMVIACCVLPLCACARVQTFRVVDAETGQPVNGAMAERYADVSRPASSANTESLSLPVEVASTNVGGIAKFRGAGQQFSLKKDGYESVTFRSTLNGVMVRHESTGREVPAERVEGMTYIPLRRISGVASNTPAAAPPNVTESGVKQVSYNAPIASTSATAKSAGTWTNAAASKGAPTSRPK